MEPLSKGERAVVIGPVATIFAQITESSSLAGVAGENVGVGAISSTQRPLHDTLRGGKRTREEEESNEAGSSFKRPKSGDRFKLTRLPPELALAVLSWCDTESLSRVTLSCRRFASSGLPGTVSLPQAAARVALQRRTLDGGSRQLGPQLWIAKLRIQEKAALAVDSIKALSRKKAAPSTGSKGLLCQAAAGGPDGVMEFVERHFPLAVQSRVSWTAAVILSAVADPDLQENGAAAILALAGAEAQEERRVNCQAIRAAGAVPYLVHVLVHGSPRAKRRAAAALAHLAEVDPANAVAVVAANAVPALSAMAAAESSSDHGKQFAAWALGHIASAGGACAEAVVGVAHVLVQMVQGASDKGRRKAAWALARAAMSGLKCAKALAEAEQAIEGVVAMLVQGGASVKNKTRAAEVLGLIASAGPKYRLQVYQCEGALGGLERLKNDRTLSMQGQRVASWAFCIVSVPTETERQGRDREAGEGGPEATWQQVVDARRPPAAKETDNNKSPDEEEGAE